MSTPFTIFPAIDLHRGQVVRLQQGDPNRQAIYSADPQSMAVHWRDQGAEWLHVVNLDGAFNNDLNANWPALQAIVQAGVPVQFGGGLRSEAAVQAAFEAGVQRVVLGTAAVENPALLAWALAQFGAERVAVGIDAFEGVVRIKGWGENAGLNVRDLATRLRESGLRWCIFTDVSRDGMGAGINMPATMGLARLTGWQVIASGGVRAVEDVLAVRAAGLPGVIIGRALYERQLNLPQLRQALTS